VLEKPDLPDDELRDCLQVAYGLALRELTFLPLGADVNTAVYRAVATDGTPYFVKLRSGSGPFDDALVRIPQLLHTGGMREIIAAIPTHDGALWTELAAFKVILYPFIVGQHGAERPLSDEQWLVFGRALKALHSATLPAELGARLPQERYAPHFRDSVRTFQQRAASERFDEPVAARLAELLNDKRARITALVERAEQLAARLSAQPPQLVLCHADIHAYNLLLDAHDRLYIVDWDTLILAPKERDLMFVGAGIGGVWNTAREEELFYQGYGPTQVDRWALAYYRYERIVEDIAAYSEALLLTDAGGDDREPSLRNVASNFWTGGVLELAQHAYPDWRPDNGN
jgi:spectinomycin phosphotransferase